MSMSMFEIGRKTCEVAEFWGDMMPMMAMEEAGEFIQAISKYERALVEVKKRNEKLVEDDMGSQEYFDQETKDILDKARQGLIEELGDMWISLMALQAHYEDGSWADAIDTRVVHKLSKKY